MDKYPLGHQLYKPEHTDPYLVQHASAAALCPQCGAFYQGGHWTWKNNIPHDADTITCPACRRIGDNAPAGTLTLRGHFLREHETEILNLIQHTEQAEKAEHPLERILKQVKLEDGLQVTTTGIHLANRLGHALNAAYKGHSQYHYSDSDSQVHIHWQRD